VKISPYLKNFPCPAQTGQRLLYSTRKGSLLLISAEALRRAARGEELPAEVEEVLRRTGMLVEDQAAERETGHSLMAAVNQADPALNVAVIVTLACNFSCPYCYEGSLKSRKEMSEAAAAQLIEFLKARFRPGKKKLVLDFYGGEPLLAVPRIKQIAGPLQEFARSRGASFNFSLVTNGSLLSPKIAAELKEYGLRVAKVTLDGPAEVHNRSRPFRNRKGSYDRIVANLAGCCDLIKVGVQGNFTRESYRRIPELLDDLSAYGLTPDRLLQVNFSPVIQTKDQFALTDFHGGCSSTSEPWVAEASVFVREETMRRGYRVSKITPSPCMVDLDDAFTVHVDGSLFKCMAFIGHTDYAVGDVWQGMTEYSEVYNLDHWRRHEECNDCVYLPLCFGGCRYMEFQRHGAIKGVDCQKDFWDAALERLVLQSVTYRQSP
jgi:uncharacterized protein